VITRRTSSQRWIDGGWETYDQAYRAFRAILSDAAAAGLRPGSPLSPRYTAQLDWLLRGHPQAPRFMRDGVAYFTFYETGRDHPTGRYGFAVVDQRGVEHPFSLRSALTGFDSRRFKPDPDSPFHGFTS
jgi:hypothetical protein